MPLLGSCTLECEPNHLLVGAGEQGVHDQDSPNVGKSIGFESKRGLACPNCEASENIQGVGDGKADKHASHRKPKYHQQKESQAPQQQGKGQRMANQGALQADCVEREEHTECRTQQEKLHTLPRRVEGLFASLSSPTRLP
ncbi:hypothetical protein SDC9_210169 [bioreactor metagenome]|uniref:Uncharacterized protein n=1 Tax=bioreactor metagenome TaxID=1076179 RepID=A0A645JFN8_9ZZZZ